MAPFHRWSFHFECPTCGRSGFVKVAEDAGPPFTAQPRRTYAAAPGFTVTDGDPIKIACDCGSCLAQDAGDERLH